MGDFESGSVGKAARPLAVVIADTGTPAGVAETVLKFVLIAAGTLNANGKRIRGKAWGTLAANANAKTLRLRIGTVTLVGTVINAQPSASPNNGTWELDFEIVRTAVDVQYSLSHTRFYLIAAGTTLTTQIRNAALALDDAAAFLIEVTGQNGAVSPNDIVASGLTVEVVDAP